MKTKTIICHKCGFPYEVNENYKEFNECYTPSYCHKNQENHKNNYKYKGKLGLDSIIV